MNEDGSIDLTTEGADGAPWQASLRAALSRAPEPERARELAIGVLSSIDPERLASCSEAHPERLAEALRVLCGVAPFIAARLRRRPEWLLQLVEDDLHPRTRDEMGALVDAALESASEPVEALRVTKYRELARITLRDCDEELVPLERSVEVLRELSLLADALLGHAHELARAEVAARFGPPRWRTRAGRDVEPGFVVLGLGKLGAEELNYSSDVDLIYVHESVADVDLTHESDQHASLTPTEYFTRVAQAFGKLASETTGEGFLYRVDLELRPEGKQGNLVVSDEALAAYYENWADTWEKATFMKARPVAGDLELGYRAINALDPMVYRSSMDYAGVEAIRRLKDRIADAHGHRDDGFHVKVDAGGIRDIEFIVQALQLLHGGRIDQVRSRSTPDGIARLRDVHLLSDRHAEALLCAYRFLRRVENRLQMVAERQTHLLPADPERRRMIARAMGFVDQEGLARFDATLEGHRGEVTGIFGTFFFDRGADRIFELLARNAPHLLATDATRAMLEDLAESFAREIDASGDAERALNSLDRFVDAVGGSRFYFELLLDRPELVPRLSKMFASSRYLSAILATHPVLIEKVFHDPDTLLLDRQQLEADLGEIVQSTLGDHDDDEEAELDALRRFYHRQLINVGLLDLARKVDRSQAEHALTELAEVCIERALFVALRWVAERRAMAEVAEQTRFVVVGMGKLASHELTYGSDLDLIFLFDTEHDDDLLRLEAQQYSTRVAQRLISILQTKTGEGACYEVDARLRPSGNQGTLVCSLASLVRYHEKDAQVWERQILLRARPVAGPASLRDAFEAVRREVLSKPLPEDAVAEIHRIRVRMEQELANEGAGRRDFKLGKGGLLDVETVAQWLQLAHGREHPELWEVAPMTTQLGRLAERGLLNADDARALTEGWEFLTRLGARLRVVENRSISDLDEERGDLEGVARSLGYTSVGQADRASGREGGARRALLSDYRRHTERIRRVYERCLGAT